MEMFKFISHFFIISDHFLTWTTTWIWDQNLTSFLFFIGQYIETFYYLFQMSVSVRWQPNSFEEIFSLYRIFFYWFTDSHELWVLWWQIESAALLTFVPWGLNPNKWTWPNLNISWVENRTLAQPKVASPFLVLRRIFHKCSVISTPTPRNHFQACSALLK